MPQARAPVSRLPPPPPECGDCGAEVALSFGLTTVLFALIYRFIPRADVAWHDVWIGAAVTAILFAVGKLLIGLYLGKSSVASSFGAAGSLVVVILRA